MSGNEISNFPSNLKALKESGWESKSVKEEMRANLISMLERGDVYFQGS